VGVLQRLLERVHGPVAGQALDGAHLVAVGLDPEHEAGAHGLVVEEHRARPAHAVLAPEVRAGEPQVVAQHVGERGAGLGGGRPGLAVDGELDGPPFGQVGLGHAASWALRVASASARATSTPPTLRR
jgi:hypothetical protein